jgi:two-component system, sensor histidine kinase
MVQAALPANEQERIAELQHYEVLDTPPEKAFDRLTRMAARRFGMPIALISLVDKERQWFKSRYGLDATETHRDLAFCAHVILGSDVMVVNDTTTDPRFANNPLVTGNPDIRFYAGAPLKTSSGYNLGTMCIIDTIPHLEFNEEKQRELAELASITMDEMELRVAIKQMHTDMERIKATQEALDLARAKTDKIIQEKTQFIANISHELRTPMNGIIGMVYLLNDTVLDTIQREYIDTISHSADNLLLLVNDVLDISKIEAGELILEQRAFDLKNSFTQTIKILKPLADKKNIQLFSHVDYGIPDIIVGDSGRFSQIITNLVGNAVKFTNHGSVNAYLHYNAEDGSVLCEVKDTGIGIPESKHSVIFEKFVQGDAAITQKYGGTGLGLTITKQLVTMLGGHIGFDSKAKEGSRFWFILPMMLPDESHQPKNNDCSHETGSWCIPVQNACVLVAEDHPVNQLFLVKILQKFGFNSIEVAENGIMAMEKIYARSKDHLPPYDAIFMDCKMPEMDGYEATKLIRKEELKSGEEKHIPIFAMTANALAGDRELCLESGMDEYLTKPLQPNRLKETLSRWFVFSSETTDVIAPTLTKDILPPIEFSRLALIAETEVEKADLLALFFRISDESILVLEKSKRNEEFTQWKTAAHSIKGSAGNIGMQQLAELCLRAEHCEKENYDYRSTLLIEIKAEIIRIKAYIHSQHPNLLSETHEKHCTQ